ncbi:Coenzyme F420 hydrogenase/dehydrogenase, beta subunit C-terminal domain [Methanobacterium petrolearium]|uniref:Coenzyme F420 hydrogenase/dehydrogenase, beta subunit C-terminal domain n=1 Tax=Methanobacterium petrolearium TaxID=710190 RepID=UPI003081FA5D|nr:coenzyme F420 hydrogenase [Methanobacterium petrolearium]
MNVVDVVVKHDYCIGCGVCSGTCPSTNLCMDWSSNGELIPYAGDGCKENCSICLDVCPFYDHPVNQDDIADFLFRKTPDINHHEYTGYYLNCYVGFQEDEQKRLKSASGGLATCFLVSLLKEGVVDNIVAVGIAEDRMYDHKILKSPGEVYECAGSAYYPVEISRILKVILEEKEDESYGIIALPCVVYGLRLAMLRIPKLKRKIKVIASLTCGQLQNRYCTELLALESGVRVDEIARMDFRRKKKGNMASDYLQVAIDLDGKEGTPQSNHGLPFHLWHYHYFKQNSCNFCDDVFGELADVTFMDAWLEEYMDDYRGTSLVIVRTPLSGRVLEGLSGHEVEGIDIQKVIQSQMGVIQKKRVLLCGKLYKKETIDMWYPKNG